MLRLMIVDDEQIIREALSSMIDYTSLGYKVIATAKNGMEAYDRIRDDYPDVVITDIKMPVMTGIDFMTACRNHGIKTKFIVLSGFSDFAYVKSAAQIGIENYLLKPIDHQEMSRTLRQVQKKIEAEQRNKIFVDEGIRIFKNNLLFRLITGKISVEDLQER